MKSDSKESDGPRPGSIATALIGAILLLGLAISLFTGQRLDRAVVAGIGIAFLGLMLLVWGLNALTRAKLFGNPTIGMVGGAIGGGAGIYALVPD